jgi:serine O-acetyltransferase
MVLWIHRCAHHLWRWHVPVLPTLLCAFNRVVFAVVVPASAKVGRGVTLGYQGLGTVIHKHCVIGDHVLIASGVTLGGREGHAGVPVLHAYADIGTGAKVLGPVVVGEHAVVGANAVVLHDVPPWAVVAGVPARVLRIRTPHNSTPVQPVSK